MLSNRGCCSGRQNGFGQMPFAGQPMGFGGANPTMECQVVEPTITQCQEREFYHEVPHVCPIHTHVVNKHIYKHTYTPQYSCSEENQVCNIDCGKCSGFLN